MNALASSVSVKSCTGVRRVTCSLELTTEGDLDDANTDSVPAIRSASLQDNRRRKF